MQLPAPNYDEALVPGYALPPLLRTEAGVAVERLETWRDVRRPELLELFKSNVYGRFDAPVDISVAPFASDAPTCGGLALRSELDVTLQGADGARIVVRVLTFTPRGQGPFPAFIGLNLFGNQTIHPDPAIRLAQGWVPNNPDLGLTDQRASEASRGMHQGRFPIEALVARGFALVTAYVGDIDPDLDDGFHNGVHALLAPSLKAASDSPGTLAAWAWGLSRLREALVEWPRIDAKRLVVFGHSRLGKAALWAAAQDEAFALAISNQSGCGGATLSRRCFGERLLHINQRFPHWFCPAFHAYNDREHELPVDQHQLLALLAPRPVYVGSAAADLWADPLGERLACEAASPVYELFRSRGFAAADGDTRAPHIGYHVRPGRHDIIARDFWHYLQFAEMHLNGSAPAPNLSA